MAAVTTALLVGAAAIGTASNVVGAVSANKRAKEAKSAIESYDRQELVNFAAMQAPSVQAEELRAAETARATATQMAQLSKLGSRGVGMAATVAERQDLEMAKIAAQIESKQDYYKQRATEGAFNVQAMQERREQADLAGLGQMYNTARQERAGYISGAAGSLMSGVSMFAQSGTPQAQQSQTIQPTQFTQPNTGQIQNPTQASYNQFYDNQVGGFNIQDNITDSLIENPYGNY